MRKTTIFMATVSILLTVVVLTGCADVEQIDSCVVGHTYGFWGGLWHGLVAPIAFLWSLTSDDIAVYALNNSGGWYDFGFIIGIGGFSFGAKSSTKK